MKSSTIQFLILVLALIGDCFSQQNIGTILQISDLHYDRNYIVGSSAECLANKFYGYPCCHSWEISNGPRKAGLYGDINCDTPASLLNATFEFMATLNPDVILWTGDSPAHNDLTQTPGGNLEAIEYITNLFKEFLPNSVVYPCYGNHDTWPVDQLSSPTDYSWLLSRVADYWGDWIRGEHQLNYLAYGGYYALEIFPGLLLVSINTLYYDSHNELVTGDDPAAQMAFFEDMLIAARLNNASVWIIGHIYPGNGEATDSWSDWYQKTTSEYSDVILGHFFGHSHKDQFAMLRDGNNSITGFTYINPSVTPFGGMNPSIRLYTYDKKTFEILDIIQYHADLNQANATGDVQYEKFYSAKEAFGLEDMSVNSWSNLIGRMNEDQDLFAKWINIYSGGLADWGESCTGTCKQQFLCGMSYSTKKQMNECMQNQTSIVEIL